MSHGTNGSGALWGKAGVIKSVAKKEAPTIVAAPRILVVILPVITIILPRRAWCRQQSEEAEISALFLSPYPSACSHAINLRAVGSNAVEDSTSNKHR
jgi:hypothetical protein